MRSEPQVERVALVADSRLRNYIEAYALASLTLQSSGVDLEVVFLDASDEVLIRRFSQTRRPHPLNGDDLLAGLREERKLLEPMRAQAAVFIDTSELTVHQLKQVIQDRYRGGAAPLTLSLLSFGFRYGLPSYADLVLDVRFLPNPFFRDEMRHLTGLDPSVAQFVLQTTDCDGLLERTESLIKFLLPRYQAEGKVYLTVAIGCTGGRHRSVVISEELARRLQNTWTVRGRERDVEQ